MCHRKIRYICQNLYLIRNHKFSSKKSKAVTKNQNDRCPNLLFGLKTAILVEKLIILVQRRPFWSQIKVSVWQIIAISVPDNGHLENNSHFGDHLRKNDSKSCFGQTIKRFNNVLAIVETGKIIMIQR